MHHILVMTGEPSLDTAIDTKQRQDRAIEHENQRRRYQAELERLVRIRNLELQDALESIVLLLGNVVEIRDPYTAGHQRRVGNLAAAIAERLGCTAATIHFIRIIGYLHDIGKMVVPAEILNKPGRLNEHEFGLIRMHPQQGFDMLKNARLPGNIAEIIRQHHERENGSGYPFGLTANQISDEAAILIIADVVEAMMSHRPYRPALGLETALSEIRQNSGILYRPAVVDACINLFTEDQYTLDDKAHPIEFAV